MNYVFYWMIFALLCTMFELGTPGLFWFLSFSIGSCVAAVAAVFGVSFDIQLIIFLCGVIFGFVVLRRISKKLIQNSKIKTNISALQGRQAVVIKEIAPYQVGQVNLGGEIWSAKTMHGLSIPKDSLVEVIRVSGCHLIVKNIN